MAALPWYQIASDFSGHPKTHELCARLRDPNAGMYVVRLMEHCAAHAQDGRMRESEIEETARWERRRRGALIEHLMASGFLDREGEVYVLHGWEERNGSRIRRAVRDAAKPRGNKPASPGGPPRDGGGTGEGPARDGGGIRGGDVDREEEEKIVRTDALADWNRHVSEALARTAPFRLKRAAEIRAHIARLGLELSVSAAVEAAKDAGIVPGTGDWFDPVLAKVETPAKQRAPGETPKPGDEDFNDPSAWPSMQAFFNRDAGRAA